MLPSALSPSHRARTSKAAPCSVTNGCSASRPIVRHLGVSLGNPPLKRAAIALTQPTRPADISLSHKLFERRTLTLSVL
jgi:hypothetical protein